MKKTLFAMLAAMSAQCFAATSVSQYGITWTWTEDLTVGQYANGDYYVVAPSGLTMTDISPASTYTQTSSSNVTITQASPAVVTWNSHGFRPGQLIRFSTTGSLPSGLTAGTWYYVGFAGITTNTFRVSTIPFPANTYVNTSSAGSGVHTCEAGRVINGTMTNPIAGDGVMQGFDSSMTPNKGSSATFAYDVSLNAARPDGDDLSVGNPLVVAAGTSLVSSISNSTPQNRPQLTDAAVLTVVASAPPANSMRPPYCGTDKTHNWNADDLNYNILLNYSPVAATPSLASISGYMARPWIEIETDWPGREMHPSNNQPDYGASMSNQVSDVMLSLNLSYTEEQKEPLYINVTQYGIDVYGAAVTGGDWRANGGHDQGRKMPMLLAGLAFNDANILEYADAGQHFIFQEDQQTFYIAAGDVALTNSAAWNPDLRGTDSTVTISNASPAVVSWANHGLRVNSMVKFTTTGTLPSPLAVGTEYYIASTGLDTNSFQISATQGPGSAINTTTDGSGLHEADAASPYVSDDIGTPEWGLENLQEPEKNQYTFTAVYRDICYNSLYGHALVAHFLDATDEWNWPAFFDYMDRSKAEMPQDGVYSTDFANNMWAAYRTPPTGPQLVSAVIGTGGTSVTYTFNVSVSIGAGGNGGMTASPSGGAATLTYASGAPGTELVYNLSRTILAGENVPGSYTQPGNGIEATVGGEDLTSIPDLLITNNSTYQIPAAMSNGSRQRLFPGGGGF